MKTINKLTGTIVIIALLFSGCKKELSDTSPTFVQKGNVLYNTNQNSLNSRIKVSNKTMQVQSIVSSNLKSSTQTPAIDLNKNYVFKLVAEVAAPTFNGSAIQATHVKIIDHYAFVTYNTRGDVFSGGLEVFDVSDIRNPKILWQIVQENVDISSVDYRNNKIYLVGATNIEKGTTHLKTNAMLEVISVNSNMEFVKTDTTLDLSGHTGTDVKVTEDAIFAISGAPGYLKIINPTTYATIDSFYRKDARSIDSNTANVYIFDGNPGLVSVFNKSSHQLITEYSTGGAMQVEAESKLSVTDSYIFTALNEAGIKILNLDGTTKQIFSKPPTPAGKLDDNYVSNAVAANGDLVLIANGEAGLYVGGMISSHNDSVSIIGTIQFEDKASSNFVESRDSIIFVATGLGGLKILTIGIDEGLPPVIIPTKVCSTLYSHIIEILPEGKNNKNAHPELFQKTGLTTLQTSVVLSKESEVYITFVFEGAGWRNTLGYYTYNANNPPASMADLQKTILFPNVSQVNEGGSLEQGFMVQIGTGKFPAGTVIGFYLVAQGWQNGLTVDGKYTNYTDVRFNPNSGQQHLLFKEKTCGDLVLTFEDIQLTDNSIYQDFDFNDIMFTISDNKKQNPQIESTSFVLDGIPTF